MTVPGPTLVLVRHGETEWSRDHKHTGRTDLDLTPAGEEAAEALRPFFEREPVDAVLCSPMLRGRRTAELAGLVPYQVVDDLTEWDYGEFEGRTSEEIQETLPGWNIWHGPWRGGETAQQVAERADRVIQLALRHAAGARVALVAHGHMLRVVAARWIGQPARAGAAFALDTSTVGQLGWEHANRVIRSWNAPVRG